MAEKKTPATAEEAKTPDLVPYTAFYDGDKYKDDIFVCINGVKRYAIKRGKTVMIPKSVYNVLIQSAEQDQNTAAMMNNLSQEFEAESKKY